MKRVGIWTAASALAAAGMGWAQVKPPAQTAPPAQVKPAPPVPAKPAVPGKPVAPVPLVNPKLPKETQAAQLVLRAEEMQERGQFDQAAAILQQAAELTPGDWTLWEKAGWGHLDAGQAAPALKAFENSRKAAPPGTPVFGGLLISQYALGNPAEVLRLLKESAPPEQLDRAVAAAQKGLAAKPRSADWSFGLGYLYVRVLGNSARGLEPLEAAVTLAPANAEAWLLLVEVNQELNRGRQEDAAALKYLELAPETPDAYRLRAQRFVAVRKEAEAIQEYEAGIAKHPAAAELYYGLARVHERLRGLKQAEAVYRKLIAAAEARKLDTLRFQARMQLANFQARQRLYAEAEPFFREAAGKPDAPLSTVQVWGSLLALTGKWEESAKVLEGAAARAEKERDKTTRDDLLGARYRAAACRLATGQTAEAKSGFEAALALAGETRTAPQIEAAAFLAYLGGRSAGMERLAYARSDERWAGFTWRQQPEEGELEVRGRYSVTAIGWRAILQQVQKRFPDCWAADYALARIYAAGGYTDEALALLTRVTRGRPDWWAPYYAVGEHHARARRKDEGIPPLRKTLQLAPECRQARVYLSLLSNLKTEDE